MAACARPALGELLSFSTHVISNARRPEETRQLCSLWEARPVVLVFLRRLGCALCRTTCAEYSEALPQFTASGASIVCLTFERLGEGSDSPPTFEAGGFWQGPLYTIDQSVYLALFGSKGLFNGFFGLADVSSTKLASCTERKISGNYSSPASGLVLGGQFVVSRGGVVILDHRQRFFGDDLAAEELLEGVAEALALDKGAEPKAASSLEKLGTAIREWGGANKQQ